MTFHSEVVGIDAVIGAFERKELELNAATQVGVDQATAFVEEAMKAALSRGIHERGTKTGASPGGPPWQITTDLTNSVVAVPAVPIGTGWMGSVGPTMYYGPYLERGTSKMPAYPFVGPTHSAAKAEARAIIVAAWRAALAS